MKRKIITIDEEKCNGCGNCVTACAEGALQIVNGKARVVREQFCDGFGDCVGECPTGALRIEEREAEPYDEAATRQHVLRTGGVPALEKMEAAALRHSGGSREGDEQDKKRAQAAWVGTAAGRGGCPGSRIQVRQPAKSATPTRSGQMSNTFSGHAIASDLEQWPVQIHLVPPDAPFFKNRALVVLSTCSPVASADIHWRFIRGRGVVVGCPKLDDTSGYVEKIAGVLRETTIPQVMVVRMEVPCCGGLTRIVEEAVRVSGRRDLAVEEVIVGVNGDVIGTRCVRTVEH